MKINVNVKIARTTIGEISPGQVFLHGGNYYITAILGFGPDREQIETPDRILVVDLSTGFYNLWGRETEVTPVKAILTVEA